VILVCVAKKHLIPIHTAKKHPIPIRGVIPIHTAKKHPIPIRGVILIHTAKKQPIPIRLVIPVCVAKKHLIPIHVVIIFKSINIKHQNYQNTRIYNFLEEKPLPQALTPKKPKLIESKKSITLGKYNYIKNIKKLTK